MRKDIVLGKLTARQRLIAIIASALVVLAVITFALILMLSTPTAKASDGEVVKHPHSMLVGGKEVMLVRNKKAGVDALSDVVKEYIPEGTKIKTVTFDRKIEFKERDIKPFDKIGTVRSEEEAKLAMEKRNGSESPLFTATIISEKFKKKKIEPLIKFKYDKDLDVYDYKVKRKGEKGVKETRYEFTSVNGEVTKKEKKETEVTLEPVTAIIVTGDDEAPKKMKWRNYGDYKKDVKEEHRDAIVGEEMLEFGKKHLGAPYKWGGKSFETGIDCVQFVRAVYKKFGITLPGKRSALAKVGREVSLEDALPGDIVYYGNHVAMYAGDGKIIHAQRKGINIGKIDYRKYSTIRRVDKKK